MEGQTLCFCGKGQEAHLLTPACVPTAIVSDEDLANLPTISTANVAENFLGELREIHAAAAR